MIGCDRESSFCGVPGSHYIEGRVSSKERGDSIK